MNGIEFEKADGISVSLISEDDGLNIYKVRYTKGGTLRFYTKCVDCYCHVSPVLRVSRHLPWGSAAAFESRLASWMPLFQLCSKSGNNRLCIALSEVKKPIKLSSGVKVPDYRIVTELSSDGALEALLHIDSRDIPFDKALDAVAEWYATLGYKNKWVPRCAFDPVYSTWYAYMQEVTAKDVIKECRHAKRIGLNTVIVDDGWQNTGIVRDYSTCGDWVPAKNRFPDMRKFTDSVHAVGMRAMLWFSVPFVGWDAKSFTRFSGKYLYPLDKVRASVLDPRYPEVREFLISNYVTAVRDWGFDGLKLDFIDRFKMGGKRCEGMDIDTVEDAVERLLSDVLATLRAINPDVLIEFRQPYMGPVISTYGNMLRVWDCPCDAMTNRVASTDLRLITRGCAVHSDMIVWDKDDTDESVALQLYSVMFAVPQISVRLEDISESHRAVLLRFLKLWQSERDLLMTGELSARGPERGYTCITSRLDSRRATLLVGESVIRLSADITDDIYVNLTGEDTLFVTGDTGDVRYVVTDCRGKTVSRQKKLGKTREIYVPHTATVRFLR